MTRDTCFHTHCQRPRQDHHHHQTPIFLNRASRPASVLALVGVVAMAARGEGGGTGSARRGRERRLGPMLRHERMARAMALAKFTHDVDVKVFFLCNRWGRLWLNRLPSMRLSMRHGSSGQPMNELPLWTFGSSTGRCVPSKSHRWQVLHCARTGGHCTQVEGRRRMAPTIGASGHVAGLTLAAKISRQNRRHQQSSFAQTGCTFHGGIGRKH